MSIAKKLLMGSGGKKDSTYIDDVFSTYVYKGSGSSKTINNGIDLAGEGGMTWVKRRNGTANHQLIDTVRGATKFLEVNDTDAEATETQGLTAFNNNGFTIGNASNYNATNDTYASWSFRKQKGFFDIVTWTGTQVNRTISHSLGSVPGVIFVKRKDGGRDWVVYHKSLGNTKSLQLNDTDAAATDSTHWNDTSPTASVFSLGTSLDVNSNGANYVAYLFAGGESTASEAVSVDFDGNGDYLSLASSADLSMNGAFTIEFWVYPKESGTDRNAIIGANTAWGAGFLELQINNEGAGYTDKVSLWDYSSNSGAPIANSTSTLTNDTWQHVAVVRDSSNNIDIFINGIKANGTQSSSATLDFGASGTNIGKNMSGHWLEAELSNLRVVKGTAVYTSSFRPPTEPLTNITNTKLLCCNNSSVTGATIAPGTITNSGSTPSTDSPFDDPAGFKFGEEGDQNIIKCGSITKYNSIIGEINIGFEPQWVIIKRTDASGDWFMIDSMRGTPNGSYATSNGRYLKPNLNGAEITSMPSNGFELTSTGFKNSDVGDVPFSHGNNFIYMAVRRPDGLVGKPAEAGTDSFAMDTGNSSSTIPAFDSNFVVDMFLHQQPASAGLDWRLTTRFNAPDKLAPNTTAAESDESPNNEMDSNVGIGRNYTNVWQAWMWKRGQGFDVVTYKGNSTGSSTQTINHSLGKAPEMIWVKNRDSSFDWPVAHKGLNGGTTPWNYSMFLNTTDVNNSSAGWFNNTAPTSTVFTVGVNNAVNKNGDDIIAMLFASVDGISKCGSYTGTGSSGLSITCGFSPRLIIIRRTNVGDDWVIYDTLRGLGSGNDAQLKINSIQAQTSDDKFNLTSTGFVLVTTNAMLNGSGDKYIYYAHA